MATDIAIEERPHSTFPRILFWSLLLVAGLATLFLRRPDTLLNPQFYAEDGRVWYAEAHNLGLRALLLPHAGYMELLARLTVAAVQPLPLVVAPLIMNVVSLILQAAPAALILSRRTATIIPSLWARVVLALFIIAAPGVGEIYGNVTNTHTHLAFLAALIALVASPAVSAVGIILDVVVVAISGLSGPFGVVLAPLVAIRWWQGGRNRQLGILTAIAAVCGVVQGLVISIIAPFIGGSAVANRSHGAPLGASPINLCHLIGGKVVATVIMGDTRFWLSVHHITAYPGVVSWSAPLAVLISILGLAIVIRTASHGPLELALFLTYTAILLFVALAFPLREGNAPIWPAMVQNLRCGNRYFYLPQIGFITALIWAASKETLRPARLAAAVMLVLASFGALDEWQLPPNPDSGFAAVAARYDVAPAGTRIQIPAIPNADWAFTLTKH